MDQSLIATLHSTGCSLVVRDATGRVTTHNRPGVRDLDHLLTHEPERLRGAMIADKVTGRAAAAIAIVGGVAELYATVMSRQALPLLREAGVECSWGQLVDHIAETGDRCPLEQITAPATTAHEAVQLLHAHFAEQQNRHEAQADQHTH